MLIARQTDLFKTHRDFVAALFLKQHKCVIEDFAKLKTTYLASNGVLCYLIEGQLGNGLLKK